MRSLRYFVIANVIQIEFSNLVIEGIEFSNLEVISRVRIEFSKLMAV